MKKLFSILIAICMVIPMTFSLVACDDEKAPEEPAATQTSTQQSTEKQDAMTSDNVTLSYTSTVYDGTEKEPTVVVKYDDKVVSSDNYTVSYSNNVNVGTATVVVTSNDDSEILDAGLSFSTTFEIERHPIYVSTISQLNAAIQVTDENHVIVLANNIALERDGANKVVPVLVFPNEKNLDVAIDLAGYDINSYFRIVSEHKVNNQTVATNNVAKVNVYNSSNEESFVGAIANEIDYAIIIKAMNVFDINFENVTFKAYWGGITTNGNCVNETRISARDCKFIATKADAVDGYDGSIGAYLVSGKHIYTFENCTFEGFGGYYTKSGHHTLIDCEVKGLGTIAFDTHHERNGCWVTGSALMVDSAESYSNIAATGYTHGLTLNISGGRFTSVSKYAVEEFATYANVRNCYAFIHVTDAPEFVGSTALAKAICVEDVNSIHGTDLDVEHKHAYVMGNDAENHFDICNCGDKQNVVAHVWNSGVVVTPATFEVDGVMKYTCTVCGKEENVAYQYATDRIAIYVDTLDELNAAINNTDENHVIVLTADIAGTSPDAVLIYPTGKDYKVAIDLNGFDINSYFRIVSKHGGVATDKLADIYIFNSSDEESVVGFVGESNYYAIQIMTDNEYNINLKNVTFKAYWGAIASSGNNVSETKVNAYNCKFISTKVGCADGDAGTGAYLVSAKHIYTFKACEFEGFGGYYTKNGHHHIIDCVITANGVPASNAEYNGSGAHMTGSALVIDSAETYNKGKATGYATDLTVDIVGGVLTSASNYAVEEVSTYKVLANRVSYAAVTLDGVTYRVPAAFERALKFENSSAITSHSYSNEEDVECNKCGAKRNLANYDVWDGTIAALPEIVNNEVTIETAEQLAGLAAAVNAGSKYRDVTFKLARNIDLNNFEWTPIGVGDSPSKNAFVGIFDGQGYTIYNLKITKYNSGSKHAGAASGVGLFGNIGNHTTLKNIVIDGAEVYGNHFVAALVGYTSYSRIENCVVYNAKVDCVYKNTDDSGDKAGAIVGLLQNTKIYDCAAYDSTVSAGRDAGQLVGCFSGASADLARCSATRVTVSANGTNNGSNIREMIIGRDGRSA